MPQKSTVCLLICSAVVILSTIAAVVFAVLLFLKINSNKSLTISPIQPPIVTDGPQPTKLYDPLWFKKSPIYQIYPRSFQDSNGDGTGDLRGIISRLDYLNYIGIKNVWISPIYKSPMKDFGYDISNFTMIDPLFGTMADFDSLVAAMHARGMKCIMDFVPNHSSDQHPWFQSSLGNVVPYSDYYVWKNGKNPGATTPNNWISVFGNSSWQWNDHKKQYYLHQFLIEQPDLNYRSQNLRQEMLNVLRFWINHGVDGFRIDAIIFMVEDAQFRNNPPNPAWTGSLDDYDAQLHVYNVDQDLTYNVTASWVQMFRQMGASLGKHIFSVVEAYTDLGHTMKFYSAGVDFPFNFNLVYLDKTKNASFLKYSVDYWIASTPAGGWPNWVLGNHDNHRVATRMGGPMYTDVVNILLLLLPGTPVCYYGDEIGMTDVFVPYNQTKDPAGKKWGPVLYINKTRDPERTPMQWSTGSNAGFSSSKNGTWLPIAKDYRSVNVMVQLSDPLSHVTVFKELLALRQRPVFLNSGSNIRTFTDQITKDVFMFTRFLPGSKTFLVLINIGHSNRQTTIGNLANFMNTTTTIGTVVMKTGNTIQYQIGHTISLKQGISLSDAQGVVISSF